MATIRDLFHTLGNKHNIVTVGCSATKDILGDCFKEECITEELKDNLSEMLNNLNHIISEAKEADRITNEIHDRVYKIIDPDTGKVNPVKKDFSNGTGLSNGVKE